MKKYLFLLLFLFFTMPLFCIEVAENRYGKIYKIDAAPNKGFNYPYLLMIPKNINKTGKKTILVEGNNSGVTDDFKETEEKTLASMGHSRGEVAKKLDSPFLMPVFPRPAKPDGSNLYTHQLTRETMLIKDGPIKRPDLQILAMIKDARKQLSEMNIKTNKKVFIMGHSASCAFAQRFTILHPKLIAATACGSTAVLTMPMAQFDGVQLPYVVGVADFKKITGKNFDLKNYKTVPQFFYRGDKDNNDTVGFRDCLTQEEEHVVIQVFGRDVFARWEKYKEILEGVSPNISVRIYPDLEHSPKNDDVTSFFKLHQQPTP